ncbi:unnamed protein product, partial [Lymnaea stagnalis]
SLLGIVTNIINIRVFCRQGVTSDSPTVTFFALSVSDLLGCIFILPQPLCYYFEYYTTTQNLFLRNCYTVMFMPATYTHVILNKITSFVTVYMSVERAICVIFPLRVQRIIKVKNTVVIMVVLYVAITLTYVPYAANVFIIWVVDPEHNGTVKAVNYYTPLGYFFITSNTIFHSMILTSAAMLCVTVATVAMVTRLKASLKWRQGTVSNVGAVIGTKTKYKQLARSAETVKIVMAITAVYLVCLMFTHIPNLAIVAIPGVNVNGVNKFLNSILYIVKFDFDVFNSSIHIFFYVRMSTRYRKTFL